MDSDIVTFIYQIGNFVKIMVHDFLKNLSEVNF